MDKGINCGNETFLKNIFTFHRGKCWPNFKGQKLLTPLPDSQCKGNIVRGSWAQPKNHMRQEQLQLKKLDMDIYVEVIIYYIEAVKLLIGTTS